MDKKPAFLTKLKALIEKRNKKAKEKNKKVKKTIFFILYYILCFTLGVLLRRLF